MKKKMRASYQWRHRNKLIHVGLRHYPRCKHVWRTCLMSIFGVDRTQILSWQQTDKQRWRKFYLLLYSTHTQIYYLWSLRFVHLKKKLFLWCFKKIEKTWFCDLYSLFSFHFPSKSLFKDGPRENISSKRKNICPWDGKLIMDELILINLLSIFLWRGEVVGARDASVLNLRWIIPKT